MTANEPNDDTADKGRATTRRTFLGAAAAAAGLTTAGVGTSTATSDQPDIDIEHKYGCVKGSLPHRTGLGSHLNVYEQGENDTKVSVTGYWYDDEDPGIGVKILMDHASLSLYIDPEEARTIARDLEAAADVAEGQHGD